MDVVANVKNIIEASIEFAQQSAEETKLSDLVRITRDFLFIMDAEKAADYKLALLVEYLEDVATIVPGIQNAELLEYIKTIHDPNQQLEICNLIHALIKQFYNPQEINPHLVTFWLDRTCDMQQIKSMSALMLLLGSTQQQKILDYDKEFVNDPKFVQLVACLPKE